MRYLLLLVLILAVILILRARGARRQSRPPEARGGKTIRSVRCAECGLALPERDAVRQNGQVFCCKEHARRWQEHHPR